MKKLSFFLLAALLSLAACKSNLEPEKASAGEADFTRYIAIGNSLTAGYADNSLYRSGQENAYPAMLAAQFKLAGGGEFRQPLLPGAAGWPSPKLVLSQVTDCRNNTALAPVDYDGPDDTGGSESNISNQGPFNNLGVPGIRCVDYKTIGYGFVNPYAKRFYTHPATQRPMDLALDAGATFFSIWLGSNDVLGYATSGGEGAISGLGLSDISPLAPFELIYDSLVSGMVAHGAKGILVNIPDITTIPFFTTIDPMGLVLDADQAAQLNQAYAALGITFSQGSNYFVIQDPAAQGGIRKMKAGEYLLLTTPGDSLKCGGWGSTEPIPKQFVLSADEADHVKMATQQFNQIIAKAADKYHLALMDANAYMKTLQAGILWDGVRYSPVYVTGGTFSLDGIHLTPRGYALVANQMIKAINAQYHATVPFVEINRYDGIKFP